ncbi:MAG TPA: MBL fold metallo-hydrolase [Acidimicrobiales bacterium]|nr:MBL fold metallo-hydrolase [Acidimicrobiales bacterium]
MLDVTFYGVRGSTPCPCDGNVRYGGNTACVTVESPGQEPLVLDLGTGLRSWGLTQPTDGSFRGSALLTHIHWDHVQGLPFFAPIDRVGARLDIYGPVQEGGISLEQAFDDFMRPPYFPVQATDLRGEIVFHDLDHADIVVGDTKVKIRPVPHCGPTNGYRIERDGTSVAYISDHQSPRDGSHSVADSVLELCDGADLLIHDAQYTPEEWAERSHWGHCTVDYAVTVAREAGARRLVLFHHDPSHDDDMVDRLLEGARQRAAACGVDEVIAAYEGLTVTLGG